MALRSGKQIPDTGPMPQDSVLCSAFLQESPPLKPGICWDQPCHLHLVCQAQMMAIFYPRSTFQPSTSYVGQTRSPMELWNSYLQSQPRASQRYQVPGSRLKNRLLPLAATVILLQNHMRLGQQNSAETLNLGSFSLIQDTGQRIFTCTDWKINNYLFSTCHVKSSSINHYNSHGSVNFLIQCLIELLIQTGNLQKDFPIAHVSWGQLQKGAYLFRFCLKLYLIKRLEE